MRRARLQILLAAAATALGCQGAPAPPPTRSPSPTPTVAPAATLTLVFKAPSGSTLQFADEAGRELEPLSLPDSIELEPFSQGDPGDARRLHGRICLNQLSEQLRVPSSVSEDLAGGEDGIWIAVEGSYEVFAAAPEPLEVSLGDDLLIQLLKKRRLELSDEHFLLVLELTD